MGNSKKEKCHFCGEMADVSLGENFAYHFVECPVCGRYNQQISPIEFGYSIKDEVASYLYYSKHAGKFSNGNNNYVFLGSKNIFEKEKAKYPLAYFASEDEIKAFYPRKFMDKINYFLLDLSEKSKYIGDTVILTMNQFISAMFIKRYDEKLQLLNEQEIVDQTNVFIKYLEKEELLSCLDSKNEMHISLTPEGWKRVDELQQQNVKKSNTVFVAMSFADDMKETRETIKNVIIKNDYSPRIMDEIEHNHQIVPEMLYEIRESRFVIAELTGHNNGAYFEAGYALGFGKEVIQVCNKEKFGEDGHFDVKQINTVLWENQDDLSARLDARIKATIL